MNIRQILPPLLLLALVGLAWILKGRFTHTSPTRAAAPPSRPSEA